MFKVVHKEWIRDREKAVRKEETEDERLEDSRQEERGIETAEIKSERTEWSSYLL